MAYTQIIHERSIQRRLISVAGEIAGAAYDPQGRDADTLLDEAERSVFKIAEDRPNEGALVSIKPLLNINATSL